MERYGRLADLDRSFDIAYWQRLGPAAAPRSHNLPNVYTSLAIPTPDELLFGQSP